MVAGRSVAPGMFIPLWEESVPPTSTSQSTPSVVGLVDPQADRAVGEVDELVLAQRGDARPGDRDRLAVALDLARRQGHVHAGLQLGDVVAQLADPQLRPRQVAEHRDLAPDPLGGGADRLDRLRVALAVGVGEVEAEDVGAGLDQLLEDAGVPARRADRGDDLRPPLALTRLTVERQFATQRASTDS